MDKKIIYDSDILNTMQMMEGYEPVVYGFDGQYYLRTSYLIDDMMDLSELDSEQGEMWKVSAYEDRDVKLLEDDQIEYLKNALWMWYY